MSEPIPADEATSEPAGSRHRAREVALQVLYAIDLGSKSNRPREEAEASGLPEPLREVMADVGSELGSRDALPNAIPQEVFDRVMESFPVPKSALVFANQLVQAVVASSAEIDLLLGEHARNWRVSRMAAVDRNVLRLAAYELRDTETPVAVIIDEAVDLARRFGSDSSPSFVNGVLDGLARDVRPG